MKLTIMALIILTISSVSFAAPGRGGHDRPNITIDNRPSAPRPNAQVRPKRHPQMSRPRRDGDRRYDRRPVHHRDYYYAPPVAHHRPVRHYRRRHYASYPYMNVSVGFPIARHVFGGISVGF